MRKIICNGITQYATKEQKSQLIEEAHLSALDGYKGVTKNFNRIRQIFTAKIWNLIFKTVFKLV